MQSLFKHLAPSNDEDISELHKVAYDGDVEKLEELLQNGEIKKKINSKNRLGCTPLRLAASSKIQNKPSYIHNTYLI